MTYKNYIKGLLIFICCILITTIIITFLYNKDLITLTVVKILDIISLGLSGIITGFFIGLKSKNKGYINGLIISGIISIILILLNIIINHRINSNSIIAYIILIFLITMSSICGINKKKN